MNADGLEWLVSDVKMAGRLNVRLAAGNGNGCGERRDSQA
jgi:hypothetical protein